ncbi:MAG TPA: TetR family transcriptional regulator C-terminal domain-containing protein [Aliidongia sp.]|nr:TetR family transcriptional regulator C-terminal domain-containing protein [Aliidongia sp.]
MARPNCREKILDAAVQTLHERGFNGCGVQDITDAAGVPKGSFYNHFESKEVLGAEALDRFWQSSACGFLSILSDESLTPLDRLRRYFESAGSALAGRDYACGCLIGNLSVELSDQSRLVRDRLASVFAGWTRSIEICLRDAQRAGQVRADLDAGMLAGFLLNAWQGAVLRSRVEKDGGAFAAFQDIIFKTITV